MEKRRLGNTDMDITRIGYGAWAIGGGGWAFGWGPQDDNESVSAIHRALDLGINWIDTAAVYGLGHSEEVVAKAMKGMASKPYIFTKCGLLWKNDGSGKVYNFHNAESVRRECEDSLRRLEVDVIDLYQMHWPAPEETIEEAWQTMADLQKEGKVRFIGVSNFDVAQLQRAQAIAPVSTLQPPYSLIDQAVDDQVLPYCRQQGIGVIVYSPMASGLLTGAMSRERIQNMPDDDWRKRDDEFKEPRLSRNLALVDVLKRIGERHGVGAGPVAIAWTLLNPAVTGAIVGARNASQVEGIIGAGDLTLTEADVEEINAFLRANP